MFTDVNKPKLEMFLKALQGFEDAIKLMKSFRQECPEPTSARLNDITTIGLAFITPLSLSLDVSFLMCHSCMVPTQ
jgi:hypothetical protein